MADPRDVEYEEEEGASRAEQLIHAVRFNNYELMQEIVDECKNEEEAAELLNNTKDRTGKYLYHIAAQQGLYDVIDWLLNQDGFECDPISRAVDQTAGDTPLHSAIRFINDLQPTDTNLTAGRELVALMLEAGSEKSIKNKAGYTPLELVNPRNSELRKFIAEYAFYEEEGAEPEEESDTLDYDEVADGDDDERSVYSGSDSDEEAEFNKLKAARKAAS